MAIERDLHDLLHEHDCVIIPQWGGFLTHYRPARLDEARKLIHPPGKDLSFNRHLVRNDGLLADHLAKREGLPFDQATARIDAQVGSWRQALERNGRLELPHVGIFFRDAEHNLQFDPDRHTNYLRDAYGLRPLAAVPVQQVAPAPVIRTLPKPEPLETEEPRRMSIWWAAASVAVLLLGASAFWAWHLGGDGNAQWSGWTLLSPAPRPSYIAPSTASIGPVVVPPAFVLPEGDTGIRTIPLTDRDSVRITVDLGGVNQAAADTTAVAVRTVVPVEADLRYHVIGGCFAQPENADKRLLELQAKGYPARRLRQRGLLHPVAYGSYATRSEALAAMQTVRTSNGQAAWLLVR